MKKRIMLITDSMAMPRPEVPYEKTWVYLLKQEFPDFDIIDRPARGSSSLRLVTEGGGGRDLLETYMPGLIILQMGMTDCAPRLFRKTGPEYFFMNKILCPGLRERYIRFIKKRRTRNPAITETPPDNFRAYLDAFAERAARCGAEIIAVHIIPPGSLFIAKSPHILENVAKYNAIMDEISARNRNFHVLEPFGEGFDIDSVSLDELHIDARANKILFEKLKDSIYGLTNTKIINEP
jgi:acyl-CoA thioesterase I